MLCKADISLKVGYARVFAKLPDWFNPQSEPGQVFALGCTEFDTLVNSNLKL